MTAKSRSVSPALAATDARDPQALHMEELKEQLKSQEVIQEDPLLEPVYEVDLMCSIHGTTASALEVEILFDSLLDFSRKASW